LRLHNRRFFVALESKKSKWRTQKNGLLQGSVLAPILYNVYTNDQPIPTQPGAKSFIYADDVALAIQGNNFEEVECKMNISLQTMLAYYQKNYLKPNLDKTQVCAFHLPNRQAHQKLKITW